MDKKILNKKLKLKHSLAETNLEHKHVSQKGIATTTVNIEQPNASRVDILKSQERKTCSHSKHTLHKDNYRYFNLKEL